MIELRQRGADDQGVKVKLFQYARIEIALVIHIHGVGQGVGMRLMIMKKGIDPKYRAEDADE